MQEIVKNYVNLYGRVLRLYLTHRFSTKLCGWGGLKTSNCHYMHKYSNYPRAFIMV